MNKGQALGFGDHAGGVIGFPEILSILDHAGAEIAGMLDLHERRAFRHHDGGGNSQPARMIGHALRMVARAHGDDAFGSFRRRQRKKPVKRATLLERGGELQIFEFEKDLAACDLGQSTRMTDRRAQHLPFDRLGRGADIVESDGKR